MEYTIRNDGNKVIFEIDGYDFEFKEINDSGEAIFNHSHDVPSQTTQKLERTFNKFLESVVNGLTL